MAFRVSAYLRDHKPTFHNITPYSNFTPLRELIFVQRFSADLLPQSPGYFIGYAHPPAQGFPYCYTVVGPEDPRAFQLQGKPYLVFHTVIPTSNQGNFTRITPTLWDIEEERPIILTLPHNLMTDTAGRIMEKNWIPVILNNTLYIVQYFDPMLVMRCFVDGNCQYVHTADFSYVMNKGHGVLRGGTPFVPYRDEYHIALAHCRFTRYIGKRHANFYTAHLVLLDTTTFRIVYISDHIRLDRKVYQNRPHGRDVTTSFYYPSGLLMEGPDSLLVFGHVNDHSSCLFRLRGVRQTIDRAIELYKNIGQNSTLISGCIQELLYANMERYFYSMSR